MLMPGVEMAPKKDLHAVSAYLKERNLTKFTDEFLR